MVMKRVSRAEWEKRVDEWRKSGLSAGEFAARAGMKEGTLRHWSWQLGAVRRGAGPTAARAKVGSTEVGPFIELAAKQVSEVVGEPARIEVVLPSRALVRVPANFDEESLRRVVAILGER